MKLRSRQSEESSCSPAERASLERRAERLRGKAAAAEAEVVYWVGEFPMGDERYAIPIEQLKAVIPLKNVTSVPLGPRHVIGILRFQDQIILAMSLASLLGNRACRRDPTVLLVVDAGRGNLVAIDCEQVPRATAMSAHLLEQAHERQTGALGEIHMPDGQVVSLIDLGRLLSSVEGARQ